MAEFKTVFTKDAAFRKPYNSHGTPNPSSSYRSFSSFLMDLTISTNTLPAAGPYSQAIATSSTIYCSGQIPCDASGTILTLESSSISQMTELCIKNLSAVLKAADSDISKVVKVNVFLTSMDNFAEMNATYEKFFTHKPARSCVAVYQLPKGVPVEIECIALA